MNKKEKNLILLGLILVVICLLPIIKSGLYSDDLQNFQLRNSFADGHKQSIMEMAKPEIARWKSEGRYTPLAVVWAEFVFHYFNTVVAYKTVLFIISVLSLLAFLFYFSTLNTGINTAVWLVCFGSVIQYRLTYHDAFTSLNGLYQLLAILVFLSMGFYNFFIARQNKMFLALSVLCFVLGLLVSEVAVAVIFLIPVSAMVLQTDRRTFLKSYLPFVATAVVYLLYVGWLRQQIKNIGHIYPGLAVRYDLALMVGLLLKQLYATLPLTNFQDQSAILTNIFYQLTKPINFLGALILISTAIYIFRSYSQYPILRERNLPFRSLFFSLALAVIPALFILPSVKYQNEIDWGIGYLPVYIQNFGTATFLAWVFQYSFDNTRRSFRVLAFGLSSFITVSLCINFLFNLSLINKRSYYVSFPGQALDKFVKEGALANIENRATIFLQNDFFWKAPTLYGQLFKNITGKDFTVLDADTTVPYKPLDKSSNCYLLSCPPGHPVVATIYKINCLNGEKETLLKKTEYPCNIDLLPQ